MQRKIAAFGSHTLMLFRQAQAVCLVAQATKAVAGVKALNTFAKMAGLVFPCGQTCLGLHDW